MLRPAPIAVAALTLLGGCFNPAIFDVEERAAHDFTCQKERIKVKKVQGKPSARNGTYSASGCGKSRTYLVGCGPNGCIVSAESYVEGPAAPASRPAPPSATKDELESEPPDGAAGFDLGMNIDDARARCEEAGHQFAREGSQASCSGTVASVGFDSKAELLLCSDVVCGVRLHRALPDTMKEFVAMTAGLQNKLIGRYGQPSERNVEADRNCSDVGSCIDGGKLALSVKWRWPKGHQVSLRLRKKTRRLRLEYRTPQGATGTLDL
jgi:uncharacterized Zn-binding protein involved in type VI secretion